MERQVIISISREYGSGGHEIAEMLAKDLGYALYDRNLLDHVAEEHGVAKEVIEKFEEKPRNPLLSRRVGQHSNSIAENIAEMQFKFLRDKAESGESFIVVGRCAETVLKKYPGLISIFVLGDRDEKIQHVMEKYDLGRQEAISKINRHDKKRKHYHNHYSDFKWGDSRGYDLCINSSRMGEEVTAEVLKKFIEERKQHIK